MLKCTQEKFGFGNPIVVVDGYTYILGAKMMNENATIKKRILDLGQKDGAAKSITTDDGPRIVVSMTKNKLRK